jgi:hypothetical protein
LYAVIISVGLPYQVFGYERGKTGEDKLHNGELQDRQEL